MTSEPSRAPWLAAFLSITFAVTWTLWYAAAAREGGLMQNGAIRPGLPAILFYLGVFSPAFVAIMLTAIEQRRAGVLRLLSRMFAWNVGARWYAFAILYLLAVKALTVPMVRVVTGAWPNFQPEWLVIGVFATLLSTLVLGQSGEEVGWRGYALPRLGARIGFAHASVILGVLWAAWHLPLFLIPGTDTSGQSFPLYTVQVTSYSVAIAWLYVRTNGSLLLTMLMHAAANNMTAILPTPHRRPMNPFLPDAPAAAWIVAIALVIPAAYFLKELRKKRGI